MNHWNCFLWKSCKLDFQLQGSPENYFYTFNSSWDVLLWKVNFDFVLIKAVVKSCVSFYFLCRFKDPSRWEENPRVTGSDVCDERSRRWNRCIWMPKRVPSSRPTCCAMSKLHGLFTSKFILIHIPLTREGCGITSFHYATTMINKNNVNI